MIVLDTHIWVKWILLGESALPEGILAAIQQADRVAVSAISCFEVSLLAKRGKLLLPVPTEEWLAEALGSSGIESLPVTCDIADRAVRLADVHRDPADRIIIATALAYGAELASLDSMFPQYADICGRLISA